MRPDCAACYFFRLVDDKRRLCQLTGSRRPMAGGAGCRFISGAWSQLDQILGLPTAEDYGNSGVPNNVKPGSGFSRNGEIVAKTKFAIDDSIGFPINHTAEKLEGSLVRPEYREVPVAHVARERTRLPFLF